MSKYNDLMNKIEVTEEMKSRILHNIENELDSSDFHGKKNLDFSDAQKRRAGRSATFKRYGMMAATFAVLLIGAASVMKYTGGSNMTSTSPSYDASPSYSETMEAADEAPMAVAEEAPTGTAAEAPTETAGEALREEAEAPQQSVALEVPEISQTTGASETNDAAKDAVANESINEAQETVSSKPTAVVIVAYILLAGILITLAVIIFNKKRK